MKQQTGIFLNFSNHPLSGWQSDQKAAAMAFPGVTELRELAFPAVPADADENEVRLIAENYVRQILAMQPAAVMCMGEFGVCFAAVEMLKQHGILCVYSCAERQSVEEQTTNGYVKHACFVFRRFRVY